MKILAVETCLGACSVALLEGDAVLAHRFQLMERGHAEALMPLVAFFAGLHDLESARYALAQGSRDAGQQAFDKSYGAVGGENFESRSHRRFTGFWGVTNMASP